jgi:peptide/nickel transport system substrate-binding protein
VVAFGLEDHLGPVAVRGRRREELEDRVMKSCRWACCAAAGALALLGAGCGRAQEKTATAPATVKATLELSPTTPAASGEVDSVTWATYRPVQTIDLIQAFDYPDNSAVTLMCESLLRQRPDGSITDGLAKASRPDDRTLVLKLKHGVTFWDGKPVTPEDVVYSLERNRDEKLGGFYGQAFSRVKSIEATGADEVTISLERPDYWLDGELSQMAGVVLEKRYVERLGRKFGTPAGGTMCTGAMKLSKWAGGDVLIAQRNADYWGQRKALVRRLELRGVPDEANLTSGLLTGEIDGYYAPGPVSTSDQIKASDTASLYEGPSFAMDALVISATKGPLADVKVRQALSKAIDRRAYIRSAYKGSALLPRTLANPGSWGYGREVFQADWDKLPDPRLDVAGAKALVEQAGAAGQTITIGTSEEIPPVATTGQVIRSAAESIGLKAKLKSVSAANYIDFFVDPKARSSVDAFTTVNYPDYADPAAFYQTFAMPGGTQNYSSYDNPRVTKLLNDARMTADAKARAALVAKAGDVLMQDLPWIPIVAPKLELVMNRKITGAPSSFSYMGAPWADGLGAKG